MKYKCPKCGNVFDGQPNFCPSCGAKFNFQKLPTDNKQQNNCADVSTNAIETSENNQCSEKPYEKYADSCKKYIILSLVAGIGAFLAALFVILIPFVNDSLGTKHSLAHIFSQYLSVVLDSGFNFDSTWSSGLIFINFIYIAIVVVTIIIASIIYIVNIIRDCIRLNNKMDYTMEFYFNVKRGADGGSEGGFFNFRRNYFGWGGNSIWSIIIEFAFLFVFDNLPYAGTKTFSSVNGWISLVIIFLLTAAGLNIALIVVKAQIKKNIIKDEYKNN